MILSEPSPNVHQISSLVLLFDDFLTVGNFRASPPPSLPGSPHLFYQLMLTSEVSGKVHILETSRALRTSPVLRSPHGVQECTTRSDGGRHPQTSRKNSSSLHNRTVLSQIQNRTLTADFLVQTAQIRTPPRLSPLARIVMTGAGQDSYHSIRALALHSPPAGLLQPVACSSSASWMMDQLTPHSSHPQ
ncbi:hypothetical protein BJX65DRAFT_232234 [Aspergillus insuetus]